MLPPAEKVHTVNSLVNALWLNGNLSRSQGNWQDARGFLERGRIVSAGDRGVNSDLTVLDYQVGDVVQGEARMDRLLELVANQAIPMGGIT